MNLATTVQELARPDPVRLIATDTIPEALVRLRGEAIGERILYFYVTDSAGRLIGVVPTRRLLLADPSASVASIMVHPVYSVRDSDSLGDALKLLSDRRLLALPVVDNEGRLSGVLDVSTVTQTLFDLERKETIDEIFQMVGLHLEGEASETTGWLLRNRFPWLLLNIASGFAAAVISTLFEHTLQAVVAVAFFIPLVLTLSESVAMQTVTLSLQKVQLAGGRLHRELRSGLLLGTMSGAAVAIIGFAWLGLIRLAMVVGLSILSAGTVGAGFGYVVPRLVRHLRLDPKIASGPAVLALTDVAALFCYLGLAAAVLR